ncbi:hypothetical protein NEA10_20550 (plasmid) [Phormidium yuhuli AB48]|uniref:DUF6794 domain-containing protein n=1 Tax=Phormidium yuhuli AB48 TaxID=2940671 RepID=A0ABY5AVJ3_9CYAN|nr:DUF6794 domain-containing protein [Phormidium yuhuli]USR93298.1 hypothetical protein NEA10_20550 [Phormidium yuhuli AB48]
MMSQTRLQLNPTPDPDSPTGVMIPRTIEEAMTELDRLLPPALQTELAQAASLTDYHWSLGLWLRNHWQLWYHSPLTSHLHASHPDEWSVEILRRYCQHQLTTDL